MITIRSSARTRAALAAVILIGPAMTLTACSGGVKGDDFDEGGKLTIDGDEVS